MNRKRSPLCTTGSPVDKLSLLLAPLTYRLGGDNMVLLALVEARHSLDAGVVGLSGTRSEDNLFGIGSNQPCNIL
jgi:hypothetical protein